MALISELRKIVGDQQVLTDPDDMALYCIDWYGRLRGSARCVCRPANTDEVAMIVALCVGHAVPIVPQGGNTGVVGGSVPDADGKSVVVSLQRMNRILEADAVNNSLIAEAGCTLAAVQEAARKADRLFPLTLSSEGSCQIGGNVSTNAGGTSVLRYGNTRDLVLGLEVVLPNGKIWNGLRTLRKDNGGYDMKSLFVGAEGTLGIVTRVALKLFPRPKSTATAYIGLGSVEKAAALLALFQERVGGMIDAFELISESEMAVICGELPQHRRPLSDKHAWYVLVELTSTDANATLGEELANLLSLACEEDLVADAALAQSIRQSEEFWAIRHAVSEANRLHGISFSHDIGVPIARIADFIGQAETLLSQNHPKAKAVCVSHMGDGNVHLIVIFPRPADGEDFDAAATGSDVAGMLHDLAVSMGGTFSAEHGIGSRYRKSLRRYRSEEELDLQRDIKFAIDPKGLFNPGKIF